MGEDLNKEVSSLLDAVYQKAQEQLKKYKASNNPAISRTKTHMQIRGVFWPNQTAIAKLLVDPDMFVFQMLESFWSLFDLEARNFRNPLVQYSLRPTLELCYLTIYFHGIEDSVKRKDKVAQYWLSNTGLQLTNSNNQEKLGDYNAFLEELENKHERNRFLKIKDKGFNFSELTSALKSIFPGITAESFINFIKPSFTEIWGVNFGDKYLSTVYGWLSQYTHPNVLLIKNLKNDEEDLTHVFRTSIILFLVGYHTIHFTSNKILKDEDKTILDFKNKISLLVSRLAKDRNL